MSNRRVRFAENVTIRSRTSNIVIKMPVERNVDIFSKPRSVDVFDPLGVYAKQEAEIEVLENEMTENGTPAYPDLRDLFNYLKPTAADLIRTYTEEELKEFCLRVKCKVRMDLFNPVEDYARRLRREGRLQNRSERYVNKILTKAIMRNKATALYSQEEIALHRQFQWRERRRQNNLNLLVWKTEYQFAQNKKRKHQLSQVEINTQNSDINDDSSLTDDTIQSLHEASIVADNNNNMSEEQQASKTTISSDDDDLLINDSMENNPSNNISRNSVNSDDSNDIDFLKSIESEYFDGNGTSLQSQSNGNERKSISQESRLAATQELVDLHANTPRTQDDVCDISINSQASQGLLQEIYQLHTESMTIDEYNGESEEQTNANKNATEQSEPLLYDYFNSQVPLTSTQSQHGSTQPE